MQEHPKVDLMSRFLAALIDGVLSSVVSMVIPVLGGILATVYMLGKDGLFDGRSVGKKVLNIQVVTETGQPADYTVSAKRNAIFAVPYVIMIIPVLGWAIAPIVGLSLAIIETVLVFSDTKGRRLGDKWAGTQVIKSEETSDVKSTGI